VALHRAVEDAVLAAMAVPPGDPRTLRFSIEKIGDRPAGQLAEGSALLGLLRAVDRHLAIRTELRIASTDANIPLSLGVPAVSIGGGGEGGGIHTRGEWYDARGRELGLRRLLLLLLGLAAG
jgi:di/tripeptidase